ncbi:hypothetical protein [Anabaena sp. UHCC 0399]|uniref:hypothetical protein n=1 Tax=Anabaena sp. UHCC 0399 TaxID=3110238 RepID=UPI0016830235|nr:hypothetical protein [Anabaena sp. UHCC 0399]MBD2361577.1 hypothetical protein [Anabaena minutissima FACHB-250]MEA5565461.1 hypothetical protein [Anabaena sp. UHCC 0399]
MDFESKATAQTATVHKPLVLLRDTEAFIRRPTVATLATILPPKLSNSLQAASILAEDYLQELSKIDLETISDVELQPARIFVGLSFVGFGALMILVLLLYCNTLHPKMSTIEQIHKYWYQYIWFVSLGVTGMFLLGREAMRSQQLKMQKSKKP